MAMLLAGENGNEFELGLIADRLDDIQDSYGDDTSITVTFRVATGEEEWEETAPVLNYFEIKNLAEWLEGIVGLRPEIGELELLEPELKFSVVKDTGETVTIRVEFHLADRPRELNVDAETDADHVDIRLDRSQVRVALQQLREDLKDLNLPLKDDLAGEADMGQVRRGDEDLNMIDQVTPEPEGMGDGEDNAGER
ncbi:MAG TPA: hypothetical protein VD997_15340 [Phycisphaerales bacterium]|nr:hypothetical protein [Phycisphaerales bacterium]